MTKRCLSLTDPRSFGEDLAGNLRTALAVAPARCRGCADYHVRYVAQRATGERFGIESDRPQLVACLRELIARRIRDGEGRVDIVMPGSADTGVLATAAHAAATLGREVLARCHFTVLDLCPTPLLLCEKFASVHGLDFMPAAMDLNEPKSAWRADILLLHSFFRFVPPSRRNGVLDEFASWIKPGGGMIFSNRIKTRSGEETRADASKRSSMNRRFAQMLAGGEIDVDVDHSEILALLDRTVTADEDRSGEFRSAEELRQFLEGSPLALTRFETIGLEVGGPGRPSFTRKRILAVLEAPSGTLRRD